MAYIAGEGEVGLEESVAGRCAVVVVVVVVVDGGVDVHVMA